jgi:hypothetical protein
MCAGPVAVTLKPLCSTYAEVASAVRQLVFGTARLASSPPRPLNARLPLSAECCAPGHALYRVQYLVHHVDAVVTYAATCRWHCGTLAFFVVLAAGTHWQGPPGAFYWPVPWCSSTIFECRRGCNLACCGNVRLSRVRSLIDAVVARYEWCFPRAVLAPCALTGGSKQVTVSGW